MSKRSHDEFSSTSNGICFHAEHTKWVSADVPSTFPPLPAVLDPVMEEAALTHKGHNSDSTSSNRNYERFEWLGDALIETIASTFIFQTFPDLSPGRLSQMRESCIRNNTLSGFTAHYGLEKRAKLPEDFNKFSRKEREKIMADLFEAYVGALVLSDPEGFKRASEWLKVLWGIHLKRQIIDEESQRASVKRPLPAKSVLQQKIGMKGILIQYKELPSKNTRDGISKLQLYHIGCFLTGYGYTDHLIGRSSALGKQEAGHKAAEHAMEDTKLMRSLEEKKAEVMATLAKLEDAQAGTGDA